jgi:hypothetical protein
MLKTVRVLLIPALALAGLSACQRAGDQDIKDKLESIDNRITAMEEAVKSGAGAPGPGAARPTPAAPPQRPPGPDPDAVYAAPIEGAPFRGGEHAKVTIVEASTFT